jgi:hypothetical protein
MAVRFLGESRGELGRVRRDVSSIGVALWQLLWHAKSLRNLGLLVAGLYVDGLYTYSTSIVRLVVQPCPTSARLLSRPTARSPAAECESCYLIRHTSSDFSNSRLTNYPAIANPKLPAEGSSAFSNVQLALSILLFPRILQALAPWIFRLSNSWTWYFFLVALFGVPVAVGYWTLMSYIGPRVNEKCILPGKGLDGYVTVKDVALKQKYPFKMPMQVFHDAYFEGKIDFKGDVLEMMEYRHDWATFNFTPEVSTSPSANHSD